MTGAVHGLRALQLVLTSRAGRHLAVLAPVLAGISSASSCAAPGSEEQRRADVVPVELRCEYRENPLGVDVPVPRLSWKLAARSAGLRGLRQSAWRVLVATRPAELALGRADLWDSGRVDDARSLQIEYTGRPLPSLTPCWWAVQVWDQAGRASVFSSPACFTSGYRSPTDWTARWIGRGEVAQGRELGSLWLRTSFELPGRPLGAFAVLASLGYHELYVNGRRVGDAVLQPCTTDLSRRVRSVTYDVSGYLREGRNVVAVQLAEGWARFARYGRIERPLLRAQLDVECALPDGSSVRQRVATDAAWRWCASARTAIGGWEFGDYGGEELVVDGTPEDAPADPATDDSAWAHAREFELDVEISNQQVEPDRRIETLAGLVIAAQPGEVRLDFGRVFTGQLELEIEGPGALEISVSEREDSDCTYSQRSRLVLESAHGTFQNRFNYVCGRWVTLRGAQPFRVLSARAHAVHVDYERCTSFACSDPLLQRIHDTIDWTLRCLSLGGYIVDCAHRERWGYGGDAHATMGTALTHSGMGAFYAKWLEDWRDAQAPDGELPYTAPTYEGGGGPAWSGICIQLPWQLYVHYGDVAILRTMRPTMERWLAWLETHVQDGLVMPHGHFDWGFLGDWVPPGRGQGKDERVDDESTLFFNNAYWLLCLQRMQAITTVLGEGADAQRYAARSATLRARLNERFFQAATHTYANGEQPYQALALLAGLPAADEREQVLDVLCRDLVETRNGHLNSGIHGTWLLLNALHAAGRDDLLWTVASQRDYPSWGHMLEQGATTIWEQWDGVHSRTHSSFLSLGEWFVRSLGGIEPDPAHPGYEEFDLRPWFGPEDARNARWVSTSFASPRGPIESRYRWNANVLEWSVSVPPNARATLHFPGTLFGERAPAEWKRRVREGGATLSTAGGVESIRCAEGELAVRIGSGDYIFTVPCATSS